MQLVYVYRPTGNPDSLTKEEEEIY